MEEGSVLAVASGHRRLAQLELLGVVSVAVRLVPSSSDPVLWDLLLEDQLAGRPLNPVEIGLYALRRTAGTGESLREVARQALPRLGLAPRESVLEDYVWASRLPNRHRDAFAQGRVPLQGARILARADRRDAFAVLDLVAGARTGVNKFSEIALWALECAWREGLDVSTWIERERLTDFAERPEELRTALRRLRFPRLAEWEVSFRRDVRTAGLPANVRVDHARGFEGGRLGCAISFSDLEELERSLTAVLDGLRAGALDSLTTYLG